MLWEQVLYSFTLLKQFFDRGGVQQVVTSLTEEFYTLLYARLNVGKFPPYLSVQLNR